MKKTKDGKDIVKAVSAPEWFVKESMDILTDTANLAGVAFIPAGDTQEEVSRFADLLEAKTTSLVCKQARQYMNSKMKALWSKYRILEADPEIATGDNIRYDAEAGQILLLKDNSSNDMPSFLKFLAERMGD